MKNVFVALFITCVAQSVLAEGSATSTYSIHIGSAPTSEETEKVVETARVMVKKKLGAKELIKKYFASIVPGVAIGATTGYVEKYLVQKCGDSFLTRLLLLAFEVHVRSIAINAYTQDCKKYEIDHNEDITTLSAQVASWCWYFS